MYAHRVNQYTNEKRMATGNRAVCVMSWKLQERTFVNWYNFLLTDAVHEAACDANVRIAHKIRDLSRPRPFMSVGIRSITSVEADLHKVRFYNIIQASNLQHKMTKVSNHWHCKGFSSQHS